MDFLKIQVVWILFFAFTLFPPGVHAQSGRTFYIDCVSGNNSNNGTSQSTAWKNLSMFNNATIETGDAPQFNVQPGDTFLLKRGCVFDRYAIIANWNGTATSRITFDAYGTGDQPIIKDTRSSATTYRQQTVALSGSYITFQNLHFSLTPDDKPLYTDTCPASAKQVVGFWYGINVLVGADNNIIQNNTFTNLAAGINFPEATTVANIPHSHQILNNVFRENSAVWTNINPNDGLTEFIGAMGVNLKGNDHVVAYNRFENNVSKCTSPRDGKWESNSVELFAAQRNVIHHNVSLNDRVFSEVGSNINYNHLPEGNEFTSRDNVWAYNTISSNLERARFINIHAGASINSPVHGSKIYNNTIYYTGVGSQGVICGGCTPDKLALKNNIIWITEQPNVTLPDGTVLYEKAIYVNSGDDINESNNIYYDGDGLPVSSIFIQNFTIDATSSIVNPQFVDRTANNLRIASASPARDRGSAESLTYPFNTTDNYGITVPQNSVVDIGSHEYIASLSTPTPTANPTPTSTSLLSSILPIADAHVNSAIANQNVGAETALWVDGNPIQISYLKFDLGLFAGRTISQAQLVLTVTSDSIAAQTIKAVSDTNWIEGGTGAITYNNRPALGATLATNQGGAIGSVVTIDVTNYIRSNIGNKVSLALDSVSEDAIGFASREVSTASMRPQLRISYTGSPISTPTPTAQATPTPTRKVGDADGDGDVDIFDYNIVLSNIGRINVTGGSSVGDFEPDGDVDIFDYNVLLTNYGR